MTVLCTCLCAQSASSQVCAEAVCRFYRFPHDGEKPQTLGSEQKKKKQNKIGARHIQIKAEVNNFDLLEVRIIRGQTVFVVPGHGCNYFHRL